ncbi:hypothetical protein FEM03_07275 [Phragmitibacter flavus]|uniref:Bacterial virulence protein VirB8 domain-containing protein n=1 Tax=Phragmitibacter flavus TaxID=2576071 RepID=A0A5R8KG95_9BACT|nr:hypothetical protein [Phragmitibacter flavus]TLD71324.1 hypothetical protein FEM03_07275 [Phragmitibacter flavus]
MTSSETLRETTVPGERTRLPKRPFQPTRIFVDKDRTAFLWFCLAAIAVTVALVQPHFLIRKLTERERVVILDPAGTYHVSPLLRFQEARDFHAQQSTLVVMAFLERNPKGLDHPELLKQLLLKAAHEKAQRQISAEAPEFKAKQQHQKPEVARIDILETRQDFVMTQVTGQLIRTGVFDGKVFNEVIPFKLALKMRRNPDMVQNGRFPTAVTDFKYEPAL